MSQRFSFWQQTRTPGEGTRPGVWTFWIAEIPLKSLCSSHFVAHFVGPERQVGRKMRRQITARWSGSRSSARFLPIRNRDGIADFQLASAQPGSARASESRNAPKHSQGSQAGSTAIQQVGNLRYEGIAPHEPAGSHFPDHPLIKAQVPLALGGGGPRSCWRLGGYISFRFIFHSTPQAGIARARHQCRWRSAVLTSPPGDTPLGRRAHGTVAMGHLRVRRGDSHGWSGK